MKRKQINKFHDVDIPENVFRSYKSEDVQGVVNTLCHKMGISYPPHVNMFNDPGHVYSSYFECTKTLNVSQAAVEHLPKYAWIGMLAHEIGHHYALENDLTFSNKLDEIEFADRIAAELTSPASVILAIKYFLKYYDPEHAPQDVKSDKDRIDKLLSTKKAEHSTVNALSNLLGEKTNPSISKSNTTEVSSTYTPLQEAKEAIDVAIDNTNSNQKAQEPKAKNNKKESQANKNDLMNVIDNFVNSQDSKQSTPKKQPKPVKNINKKPRKKSKPKIKRNLN